MDIYFNRDYGILYKNEPEDEIIEYSLENEFGSIEYMFLKRRIPTQIDNKIYYDITTPYGYGGPIIKECKSRQLLLESFKNSFTEYCLNNNIVSEFVRFHPIQRNALDFSDLYNMSLDRKTVGTDLTYGDKFMENEFSKSTRKLIRKQLKNPKLSISLIHKPSELEKFKEIYYKTMERNDASGFYYFDDQYFNKLLNKFSNNILLCNIYYENKIIASSLNLLSEDVIHVHLSGTDTEYLAYSPAYLLKYGVADWGVKNGYLLVHYGGGKSNNIDDSLYQFKKKFGKNTEFDFYIGKKIWLEDVYNKLSVDRKKEKGNKVFFPLYRR